MRSFPFCIALSCLALCLGCSDPIAPPDEANRTFDGSEPISYGYAVDGDIDLSGNEVEELLQSAWISIWYSTQECNFVWPTSAAADEYSASWGGSGMRDLSQQPRQPLDNTPDYIRQPIFSKPWQYAYTTLGYTNVSLRALERGNLFDGDEARQRRAEAFARFNQGLALGFLATIFDQAVIFTEESDPNVLPDLNWYKDVRDAALVALDQAIALSDAYAFTLPSDWLFDARFDGMTPTNVHLSQLAHAYAARFMTWAARTPAEREALDWTAVLAHLDAAPDEDFVPIGNTNSANGEWDCAKYYAQEGHTEMWSDTWHRADYYTVGPADDSGQFEAWLATDPADRNVFLIDTQDRRLTGHTIALYNQDGKHTGYSDTFPDGTPLDDASPALRATADGKYFVFDRMTFTDGKANYGEVCAPGPFPANRGTYHYSCYTHTRWQDYLLNKANGPMHVMLKAELDLLRAEALLHTGGDLDAVADLINITRVGNGEMSPAKASDGAGALTDRQDAADDASLWAKLKHEHRMETMGTQGGLAFFVDRGWGDLVTGTFLHYPVPARELVSVFYEPLYTFGGGGDGSAEGNGPGWKNNQTARLRPF